MISHNPVYDLLVLAAGANWMLAVLYLLIDIQRRLCTLQPSTPSVCEICGCSENEYPEGYRGPCCECACHAGGRIDEARPTPSATPATSAAIEAAKEIQATWAKCFDEAIAAIIAKYQK